jgi:hypothetical protein
MKVSLCAFWGDAGELTPACMCDTGLKVSWRSGRQHIANLPRCNMFPNSRVSWFILFEPPRNSSIQPRREQSPGIPLFTTETTITIKTSFGVRVFHNRESTFAQIGIPKMRTWPKKTQYRKMTQHI